MRTQKTLARVGCYLLLMTLMVSHTNADELSIESDTSLVKRKTIVIVKKRSDKIEKKGVTLGSFTLSPEITVTEYYDDNVYASQTATKDDLVTMISPNLSLTSNWKEHALVLEAGLEVTRYADLVAENTNDAWINMRGKYQLNKDHDFRLGLAYTRDHEDRASPDTIAGSEPTRFDDTTANLGYTTHQGNHFFKLIFNVSDLDFYDVNSSLGILDNDDRDRSDKTTGLRYLYKYAPGGAVFISGVYDSRDYDQTLDNEGNDRKSEGYRYSLGVELVSPSTVSKFSLGRISRDYQSIAFERVDETNVSLQHQWKFLTSSNLSISVNRSIEETTIDNSSGYLMTDVATDLNFGLSAKNEINLGATLARVDYYGINRIEDYVTYRIGYGHNLFKNLKFSADLQRAERDSSVSGENYTINQLFLRIKAAL